MALIFTNDQLMNISKEYVEMPLVIVRLLADKIKMQEVKDKIKKKDEENEVFSNNFEGIISAYHSELKNLNAQEKTNYIHSLIDDGARKLKNTPHFPLPDIMWVNLQPKVVDSNTGLPVGTYSGLIEPDAIPNTITARDLVVNGFTDGSVDDTLFSNYAGGDTIEVTLGGFVIGQRVVVDQLNKSMLVQITDITIPVQGGVCAGEIPPGSGTTEALCLANGGTWTPGPPVGAQLLKFIILAAPLGALNIGARVRNYRPPFSNTEREGTVVSYSPEVLQYFENQLDPKVILWEGVLNNILSALNSNDTKAEKTEVDAEKANVNNGKSTIDLWQSKPNIGVGTGRFGDTSLAIINGLITTRPTQITARITQIGTALGAVIQNPDGTFSGSGNYLNLFKWIDLRIDIAAGTLASWYSMGLSEKVFQQQIDATNTKKTEYDVNFVIQLLTQNATGNNQIEVSDASGYAISDNVKLFANEQAVIETTISGKVGNTITLGTVVPVTFTLVAQARILKEK